MTRASARKGSARIVLAAMVASAVAAIAPAQAAGKPAPVLQGNSVERGWSKNDRLLAAKYDLVLDMVASSMTVTDSNGTPVGGAHSFSADKLTLTFVPQVPFSADAAPYTATLTARSLGQDPLIASTVNTLDFNIDIVTPFPPNVQLNDGTQQVTISVADDTLTLNGTAADDAAGSGIASVQVHFYNPLANPQQATLGGVPEASSTTIQIACASACPTSTPISVDLSDLTLGLWTIKVSVTDAAGNRSAESGSLRVLRIAA